MSRPRKTGLEYFPHDVDAANDEKLEAMRAMYGNDGYAFYFILLERIYKTENAMLDVSKNPIKSALAKHIGINLEKFEEMVLTACDIELFDKEEYSNNNRITSLGIQKRHLAVQGMRENWRLKKDKNSFLDGKQQENAEKTPQSKAKKSKEKQIESKENINCLNTDEELGNESIRKILYEEYKNEFSILISSYQLDLLQSYINDGMEIDVIIFAIREAAMLDKRTFKYLQGILNNYVANGIKTESDALRVKKQFEESRKGVGNGVRGQDKQNNSKPTGYSRFASNIPKEGEYSDLPD